MARGFRVTLTIHDPEWLTPARVADVAREQSQWLSTLEVEKFIPGAVEAAKSLIGAIEHGPFFVTLQGVDSFGVHGEATLITVSVDSAVTVIPGQEPVMPIMSSSAEAEAEVESPSEEEPSVEAVDGGTEAPAGE